MSYHAVVTVVFFITFIAMAAWVFRPGRKQHYQSLAMTAIEDELDHQETER
ncbi:cbb3-type cytochrome oxidase subunit 3 [Alcanivorax quisquiliarum]|uniref:Cbb3-type cytochrome c oxidase subunit 3 n=1 Tax=Alcanivorax quisquiliarum TaxID=2933565 RepID=A0ABT0EA07_9GAMM|nr:cbb3-type cytochrome c oxidase subunit 3 [Alcanivorax quisquiliarum]